jgi:peptide/nickel transport system substrate-binding protein
MVGGDYATVNGLPASTPGLLVFEGLVRLDVNGKLAPSLATSWDWAEDGLSITFHLKKDVTFHNGEPFNADAVKFSFDTYAREDKSGYTGPEMRRMIKEIAILDDYTVRFQFTDLYPRFMERTCFYWLILPPEYYSADEEYFAQHPVGTGPYRWVNHQQDVFIDFEAVENHHRQTPYIKQLRLVLIPEASTRLAALKAGEVDVAMIEPVHIAEIEKDPNLSLTMGEYLTQTVLKFGDALFPDQKLPFQDERVRLAASLAIDRQAICEKVMYGAAVPYGDLIPPWLPGYDPQYVPPDPYDPERAKELLAEAGYPDGFDTQLIYETPITKAEFEATAAYLRDVGIRVTLKPLETGAFKDVTFAQKEPGLIYSMYYWAAKPDLYSILSSRYVLGNPWAYGANEKSSEMVNRLLTVLPDDEMAKLSREVVEDVKAERLGIYLWAKHQAYGVGSRVEYYAPISGFPEPTLFEYMKLK